eukprot:469343_1
MSDKLKNWCDNNDLDFNKFKAKDLTLQDITNTKSTQIAVLAEHLGLTARERARLMDGIQIAQLVHKLKKDGIKFVRFESPNISGQSTGMLVPARNSEHFLRNGFPFWPFALTQTVNTGMALDDVKSSGYRNVPSFPDVDSYRVISWKPLVPTASIMMSQHPTFDDVYPTDSRQIALRQLNILNNKYQFDIFSATEHEFTLLDADNKPISLSGCYRMERISKHDDFFLKVDENFRKMGIECDRLHSEVASGQYEITVLPKYNINAADDSYWVRNGIREMAQKYKQWNASFITHLPLNGDNADSFNVVEDDSGAHFNHSLWIRNAECDDKNKQNAFWNADANDLSETALHWIGGILAHIGSLAAFCCPTTVCYQTRFDSPWVSSEANWGKYNRTAIIRVKPDKNGKNTHFEFRLPSSLANPYLVMASVICAGLNGIQNKIVPPKELSIDIVDAKEREKCYQYKIPNTLNDALDELQKDKVFMDGFGEFFVQMYVKTKRLEIREIYQCHKNKQKPLFYSLM